MKKNDGKREMVEEHGRGETVGLVGGWWEGLEGFYSTYVADDGSCRM